MTTYRAMAAIAPGKLEAQTRDIPTPGAGEVLIKVEACGICHTDAATIEGAMPFITFPRIPGHEVVGRISAIGAGVTEWTVDQRVGVGFLGGSCGTCPSCRAGDFTTCTRQDMTGITRDGGYAEYMLARASGLVSLTDELNALEAAPLLCAGVTTFKALRESPAKAGDTVAILGLGGLGHLAVQYAKHMGFRTVAIARGAKKGEFAKQLGAHHYIDSTAEDAGAALQKLGGAKVILSTVSDSAAVEPLFSGLARHGQMLIVGAGFAPIAIPSLNMLFAEQSVAMSLSGTPLDTEDTLGFSVLTGTKAIIETFPLSDAVSAYARLMENKAQLRIVLTM
jgi:propanol-preferring alcohol dehydrogenase